MFQSPSQRSHMETSFHDLSDYQHTLGLNESDFVPQATSSALPSPFRYSAEDAQDNAYENKVFVNTETNVSGYFTGFGEEQRLYQDETVEKSLSLSVASSSNRTETDTGSVPSLNSVCFVN